MIGAVSRRYWIGVLALALAVILSFGGSATLECDGDTLWECTAPAVLFLLGVAFLLGLFAYGLVGAWKADRRRRN